MIKKVTNEEIRNTFFNIDSNKALDLDEFGAQFFKRAWKVVDKDVIKAIKFFLSLGLLLHEVIAPF